jgi:hypothetical protein
MTCRNVEAAAFATYICRVTDELPERCSEPVRYRTKLASQLDDASVLVAGVFELCEEHDAQARNDESYDGSWTLRQRQAAKT